MHEHGYHCTIYFSDLDELEDEYHFILICPQYGDIRTKYIKKYIFKLVHLFQNDNLTHIKNLARYIIETFKHKNSLVTKCKYLTRKCFLVKQITFELL